MYKIVAAVNSMIEKSNLISNVAKSETGELFFLYDSKFKWSMIKNDAGDYFLHYYPVDLSVEALANLGVDSWANFNSYVTYSTSEIKTKEALESFSDLYNILREKLFNIDSVLDQIISTAA